MAMNNRTLEQYLQKMIEIDQEALAVEARIKEDEIRLDKELRKAKRTLEMDVLKRARMEARKEMDARLEEAKAVEAQVAEQTEREMAQLQRVYDEAEAALVAAIVERTLSLQ